MRKNAQPKAGTFIANGSADDCEAANREAILHAKISVAEGARQTVEKTLGEPPI